MLRGAVGVVHSGHNSAFLFTERDHMTFDLDMIYKNVAEHFDFGKFWSGENVGISANEPDVKSHSALEVAADQHQKRTAVYNESEKCWYVELPWKDASPEGRLLTDNYPRAVAMWKKVLSVVKDEHIDLVRNAYAEIHDSGFSEKVSPELEARTDHPTYVMTSRPVIRMDKSTSKCRIVINASMPDQRNKKKTLNSLLMPGQNMLPQIMQLILHSKLKRYVASVDIRKMFLSVRLKKESDMDMLRYVWATPDKAKPDMYRFT